MWSAQIGVSGKLILSDQKNEFDCLVWLTSASLLLQSSS